MTGSNVTIRDQHNKDPYAFKRNPNVQLPDTVGRSK